MTITETRAAECTPEQSALWRERYRAGYAYGRADARRARTPRAGVFLAEIPPGVPGETGAAYVARNIDRGFSIAYTRAYRFELARQTGGNHQ